MAVVLDIWTYLLVLGMVILSRKWYPILGHDGNLYLLIGLYLIAVIALGAVALWYVHRSIPFFSDPFSMLPPKALESIGKTLHSQYERWQPKVKNFLPCSTSMLFWWGIEDYWHLHVIFLMALEGSIQASVGSNSGGS